MNLAEPRHAASRADGPLAIVFNPRSGRHDRDELPDALRALARPHRLFTIGRALPAARAVAAAAATAREQRGVLVAAGGDGTINAVAQAALDADLPFGVIPRGTFNYFGRMHELPLEADEAIRVIAAGRVRRVQVGLVNDRVFLVNGSVGLYPTLLEDRERFKREYGRTRFVALCAGFATLLREQRQMMLRFDDGDGVRTRATSTVFVGNNRLQLDEVGVPEADAVTRGRLAVICIRPASRAAMIGLALRGALGRLADADHADTFPVRRLDVEPARLHLPQVKVATDGEMRWMRWPLVFRVAPRALRLIAP